MAECKARVTDEKPFIFISYAHADKDQVYPIIEELDRRGYRIWYDEGITPGKDWADMIGRHVMECHLMLLLLSEKYVASDNCTEEYAYARSQKKICVCVKLRPTELPPGMALQMTKRQMVSKYVYQSEHEFFDKLCSCPDMEPCRRKQETAEAAQNEAEPKTVQKQPDTRRKKKSVAHKPVRGKQNVNSGKPGKKMIAVAACVLVMALLIAWFTSGGWPAGDREANGGISNQANITLSGETITADIINELNQQDELRNLYFKDCTFETGVLKQLNGELLRIFSVKSCDGVDDLSCLSRMPNLYFLTLSDIGLTDDMVSDFALLSLMDADLSDNPDFSDLRFLGSSEALMDIDLSGTNVSDLAPLAQMKQIESVVAENCPITDISPLQSAEKLKVLNLNGCEVADPGTTFTCLRLEKLYLSGCKLESLRPFENCTILERVDISASTVQEVDVLKKSVATLQMLNFSNSGLDHEDVRFMADCSGLKEAHLDAIPMENLNMLSASKDLKILSAQSCGLKDVSGLTDHNKLTSLDLSGNALDSIGGITGWTSEAWVSLDLSGNPLTDVSSLPLLQYKLLDLRCENLQLKSISAVTGQNINIYYSDDIYDSSLTPEKFYYYYVYDCPPDRQVKLEDYFGYKLNLCTSDAG